MPMRILYDGWPLAYDPLGAAAWHLRALLAMRDPEVTPVLAMPTEPQADQQELEVVYSHTHARGDWEQHILQRLAEQQQAAAIHSTALATSLFGKVPTLVSPAEVSGRGRGRLAEAQGRGGLARATILWPDDLPKPKFPGRLLAIPPTVHPEFNTSQRVVNKLSLPDEFLLVHGLPDEKNALSLLESWTWAAASIGEFYPLVIVGLGEAIRGFVQARLPDFHIESSVRVLTDLPPQDLPSLYQAYTALVHIGQPLAWGNPLRNALACGKAIVAHREPHTEAIVGAAGYLISAEDLRGFGAAMITVVVDEKAREKLEDAARKQAARWDAGAFKARLLEIYKDLN
ncbi:MAG: glycosyltransferase [Anaerolineales bacterium]